MKEKHLRSLAKSIIWRIVGILFLAGVTYWVTKSFIQMTMITVIHHLAFVLIYYLHERFWQWISWLRYSKFKSVARMILYETILGNVVLATISFLITEDWIQVGLINLIYIVNKHWMYIVFDKIWRNFKWQTK